LAELSPKQSRSLITRLGNRVMDEINRVTAVTPGALTALALLNHHRRGLPHDKVLRQTERLHATLQLLGARCTPALATNSGVLRREAIREALQMFADADMIEVHTTTELSPRRERKRSPRAGTTAIYSVVETKRVELDTSKNIIIHFFVERALMATAVHSTRPTPIDALKQRVQFLSRLFKHEFRFRADKTFEEVFNITLEDMQAAGELVHEGDSVRPGVGRDGWSGQKWLLVYASMIRNFVESYRIFARSLIALLDESLPDKDLIKLALTTGSRMYLAGEVERSEAISKPVFQNALAAFQDQGYLKSAQGRLSLAERCSSEAEVTALEAQISVYLERDSQP
jgi:glycerol-3-phosphate O-acyltransferase